LKALNYFSKMGVFRMSFLNGVNTVAEGGDEASGVAYSEPPCMCSGCWIDEAQLSDKWRTTELRSLAVLATESECRWVTYKQKLTVKIRIFCVPSHHTMKLHRGTGGKASDLSSHTFYTAVISLSFHTHFHLVSCKYLYRKYIH